MFPLSLCANPAAIKLLEQPLSKTSIYEDGVPQGNGLNSSFRNTGEGSVKAEVHSWYCAYPAPASCILLKGQLTNVEKVTGPKENKLLMFSKATLSLFSVIKNTPCFSQSVLRCTTPF